MPALTMIYFFPLLAGIKISSIEMELHSILFSTFQLILHQLVSAQDQTREVFFRPIFRPPAEQKCKLDKVVELFNLTHLIADVSLFSLSRLYIGH